VANKHPGKIERRWEKNEIKFRKILIINDLISFDAIVVRKILSLLDLQAKYSF